MRSSSSATDPHARPFIHLFVQIQPKVTINVTGAVCASVWHRFSTSSNDSVTFVSPGSNPMYERSKFACHTISGLNKEMRRTNMYQKTQLFLASAGLILGLCAAPVMAQTSGDSKMPMSEKDKMATHKMSNEEKAAMFDKMSDADKMTATKMAGHDMSKMSDHDRMMNTDKMSVKDKAMMYDKMATGKHMDKMDKAAMDKAAMDKAAKK